MECPRKKKLQKKKNNHQISSITMVNFSEWMNTLIGNIIQNRHGDIFCMLSFSIIYLSLVHFLSARTHTHTRTIISLPWTLKLLIDDNINRQIFINRNEFGSDRFQSDWHATSTETTAHYNRYIHEIHFGHTQNKQNTPPAGLWFWCTNFVWSF